MIRVSTILSQRSPLEFSWRKMWGRNSEKPNKLWTNGWAMAVTIWTILTILWKLLSDQNKSQAIIGRIRNKRLPRMISKSCQVLTDLMKLPKKTSILLLKLLVKLADLRKEKIKWVWTKLLLDGSNQTLLCVSKKRSLMGANLTLIVGSNVSSKSFKKSIR